MALKVRRKPLDGRHGAGQWPDQPNGSGRLKIVRRLNGHIQVDMRRLLSTLFILLLFLLVFSRVLSLVTNEPFPVSVVSSGSMEPALSKGDIVVWAPTRMSDVHVGDVIVFKSSVQRGTSIAHRVVQIVPSSGNLYFFTKGDANPDPDQSGLHVPEQPVSSRNYLGKVIGLDGVPLRIPGLGNLLFSTASLQGDYFGSPGSSAYPWILFPILAAIGVALAAGWMMRPEPDIKRRTRAIFPDKRLRMRRYAVAITIWYLVLMLASGAWAQETVEAGVGVDLSFSGAGLSRPAIYAEYVVPGTVANASYQLSNPGALPIRVVAFVEGEGAGFFTLDRNTFVLEGRETVWEQVNILVPSTASAGIYHARIRVYSSPLWMALPAGVVEPLVAWSGPGSVLALDLAAAGVYSILSIVGLMAIAWVGLSLGQRRTEALAMREEGRWAHGGLAILLISVATLRLWIKGRTAAVYLAGSRLLGVRAAELRGSVFAGLASGTFTVAVYFADGWSLLELALICSVSTGIAAVIAGCRYRSELVLSTCLSLGMMFSVVLAWPGIVQNAGGSTLAQTGHVVNVIALALILFLIFLIPVLMLARFTARLGSSIASRLKGLNGLEPSDL